MVIVLDAQTAVTPAGNPVGVPIPVAPIVENVTAVSAVFAHKLGLVEGPTITLLGKTVITFCPLAAATHGLAPPVETLTSA